jgi:hypothetical protein
LGPGLAAGLGRAARFGSANIWDFWVKQFKNSGCYLFLGTAPGWGRTQFYDMGFLRQVAEYFYLRKRDPNAPHTQWMKYMHGINRISIFMFLVAIIVIIVRLLFFRHH